MAHVHDREITTTFYPVEDILRDRHGVLVLLSFEDKHPVIPTHPVVGVISVRVLLYREYGSGSVIANGRLNKPKLGLLLNLTVDNIPLHPRQTVP